MLAYGRPDIECGCFETWAAAEFSPKLDSARFGSLKVFGFEPLVAFLLLGSAWTLKEVCSCSSFGCADSLFLPSRLRASPEPPAVQAPVEALLGRRCLLPAQMNQSTLKTSSTYHFPLKESLLGISVCSFIKLHSAHWGDQFLSILKTGQQRIEDPHSTASALYAGFGCVFRSRTATVS